MLDHQKIILEQVTGDNELFLKELKKSLKWLNPEDSKQLYHWLKENFWDTHRKEIKVVFNIEIARYNKSA